MPSLTPYLKNPQGLDRDTLYALRTLVARHPNYTAARLMLLHNLFVLQDPTFGQELRKAAFLLPDRRVLFDLVEAGKYRIEPEPLSSSQDKTGGSTLQIINRFLDKTNDPGLHPRPTVPNPTTDYAAFLLSLDDAPLPTETPAQATDATKQLVDEFLSNGAKFNVGSNPNETDTSQADREKPKKTAKQSKPEETLQDDNDDSFFTETLAKIYIKQGRFAKALEIISTLSANYPNKSIYFADQMRYLRKLIINENHKK